MSAFPHDQLEDTAHSQRRDLKDIENSLIQLTANLDLMQEEPERPLQRNTDAVDLGLETFRKRQSPRDHADKSWLKLRSLLRDYHQDLMLALDVSSFYQQADSIIGAINCKRNCVLADEIQKSDKETREISSQINMLNECASRLSTLHPTLARRVTCKQAEVKENWALLQEFLRNQKTDVSSKRPSTLPADPLTTCPDSQSFARNEGHSVMGKDVKEEQNRLRGFECSQGLWTHRMWSPVEECSVGNRGSLSEGSCSKLDHRKLDRKSCIGQMAQTTPVSSQEFLIPNKELTTSTGMNEEHECSKPRLNHKIEELLSQVEVLWDALQKKYEENNENEPAKKEQTGHKAAHMVSELTLSNHPPEDEEEGSSGMLEKFLELLDPSGYHKMSQDVPESLYGEEMAEATEMPVNQTDLERSQKQDQNTDELQRLLSTLTLRINQHLCRCAELSMDLLDIETDMAVLCDSELCGLEGLQEQHGDLEGDYNIIEGEVRELEKLTSLRQIPHPGQRDFLREEVQGILQACEEVGRNMAENRGRLEKFHQFQDYFESYLAMITWTENTRSCILTGNGAWRDGEVAEIDRNIETKLDEFIKLAAAGQRLMQDESQFKNIIKERTDELQSMLGWIQINWHNQKEHLERSQRPGRTNDQAQQQAVPFKNPSNRVCFLNGEVKGSAIETQPSQNNLEQHIGRTDVSGIVSQESCLSKTSLGSSICLILSFDEQSAGINQVTKQWSPNKNEIHEEPTSSIQTDENSKQIQQPQELLQVNWQNESLMTKETKQLTFCGNLEQLQNKNQGKLVQSPSKEKISSLLSPSNAESSYCNHLSENLQSVDQTNLQLLPDTDHASVMHQTQNLQSPSNDKEWTNKPAHSNIETNESDDHLQHEVAAEVTHRVFTYLHVSDSYKSPGRVSEVMSPPDAEGQDIATSYHSSSYLSQNTTSEGGMASSLSRFKACTLLKLKEPIKGKKKEQRRNSTLGTVGLERSGKPSSIFRQRCNTWPEREQRTKESQSSSKLQVFIKRNMLLADSVIDNKSSPFPKDNLPNAVKTSNGAVKNICSYLSLGSTLSFSLPKRFDNSILDKENKGEIEPVPNCDVQATQSPQLKQTEINLHTLNMDDLENNEDIKSVDDKETPQLENEIEPVNKTNIQTVNMDDLENNKEVETQQLNQIYISSQPILRVFKSVECEETDNNSSNQHTVSPPVVNRSSSVTQCRSPSCDHNCCSVYTRIKDLNGHLYYSSKYMKINSSENLLSNGPSSRKSGRIINCGVQDCAVCFSDTAKGCAGKPDICMEELLQPGHWLFQQEEEELEDIWRGRVGNLNSNYAVETNMDDKKQSYQSKPTRDR